MHRLFLHPCHLPLYLVQSLIMMRLKTFYFVRCLSWLPQLNALCMVQQSLKQCCSFPAMFPLMELMRSASLYIFHNIHLRLHRFPLRNRLITERLVVLLQRYVHIPNIPPPRLWSVFPLCFVPVAPIPALLQVSRQTYSLLVYYSLVSLLELLRTSFNTQKYS